MPRPQPSANLLSSILLLCFPSADAIAPAFPTMVLSEGEPALISLPLGSFFVAASIVFTLGGCVGFILGKRQRYPRGGRDGARDVKTTTSLKQPSDASNENGNGEDEDGPTMVLRGSLDLMSSKWGGEARNASSSVVEYLSPEKMTRLLFSGLDEDGDNVSQTLCLDECCDDGEGADEFVPSPRSSTADVTGLLSKSNSLCNTGKDTPNHGSMTPKEFLHLLSLIQRYSVDTSHPYFFNQLFGSLDPIALAAEIVALSVNTSVYTYETAPVFTLLEREVMGQIGKLVFGQTGGENDAVEEEEFQGEGLMIPGGSLANLTAMHAARHRWKVVNGYLSGANSCSSRSMIEKFDDEEKKFEDTSCHEPSDDDGRVGTLYDCNRSTPDLVAFVSSEAHYSFSKSARVLGMREDDLIVIPTHSDGRMNVGILAKRIEELEIGMNNRQEGTRQRVPFFVACTAGSTVRGSFDEIAKIAKVCRDYESRVTTAPSTSYTRSIWVHVDGAWGGSAIFSARPTIRASTHMDEIKHADSFTFNPHKMLGAPQQTTAFIVRHRNALRDANSAGARYLFDPRKNGAEYDLGDLSYTCGRRTDAVKLWALWKYYGKSGLGDRVDRKVDQLDMFVEEMGKREGRFALACKPWPFNVSFFYFPPRIRRVLEARGALKACGSGNRDDYIQIPDDIAQDLANVSVKLKLRLHEAGEMIIPYQPLNNQKADCFRLVLAGKKDFGIEDIRHVLDTMEKYGADL